MISTGFSKGSKSFAQPRIIGGIIAPADSILHQFNVVVISGTDKGKYQCGGTLISPNYVLTAAHCCKDETINKKPETATLKDPLNEKKDKTYKISKVIIHPKFDMKTFSPNLPTLSLYDFAILRLDTPAQSNKFFPCLPKHNTDMHVGANGTASGWGQAEMMKKQPSKVLKSAQVTVISNMQCAKSLLESYGMKIPLITLKPLIDGGYFNFLICADGKKTKSTACYGDSGGRFLKNSDIYF